MIVKRVGPMSMARISGALYALMGLIVGAAFSVLALVGVGMGGLGDADGSPIPTALVGVGAVILLPLVYGLLGLIMGFITAALYNMVAAAIGGLELDVE
jgi:hypothetical protein